MPIFKAKLSDGRTVTLEGDHKPTEEEILSAVQGYKPDKAPTPQSLEPDFSTRLLQPTGQPSEYSSGLPRSVPLAENPDWAFTQATTREPGQFLKSIPSDVMSVIGDVTAAGLNVPVRVERKIFGTPKEMVTTEDETGKKSISEREKPLPFQQGNPIVQFQRTALQPEGNQLQRLVEGAATPEMLATFPFIAAKPVQALFLAQTAPAAIESAKKLVSKDTPPNQRQEAATDLLINGLISYGLTKGLIKSTLTPTEVQDATKTRPQPTDGQREYIGTETQRLQTETGGGNRPVSSEEIRQEPQQWTEVPQEKVVATPLPPAEQAIEQARLAESEQRAKTEPISTKEPMVLWTSADPNSGKPTFFSDTKADAEAYSLGRKSKQYQIQVKKPFDSETSTDKRLMDLFDKSGGIQEAPRNSKFIAALKSNGYDSIIGGETGFGGPSKWVIILDKSLAKPFKQNKGPVPSEPVPTPSTVLPEGALEKAGKATTLPTSISSVTPKTGKTQAPLEILGTKENIKVNVPKGATVIRVTPKDKTKGQRVYFVSDLNTGKVTAAGGEYSKVEAGTIDKDKKFKTVKGEVTVEDKTPQKFPIGPGAMTPAELAERSAKGQITPPPNPPVAVDSGSVPSPEVVRANKDYNLFNRINSSQWIFYFGKLGEAAKSAWERMVLGEFKMRESVRRDIETFVDNTLKLLPRKYRKAGGQEFFKILDGKTFEQIRSEWEGKPGGEKVISASALIKKRLEEIRSEIRDIKRDSFKKYLMGMDKPTLQELFKKNINKDIDIGNYTKDSLSDALTLDQFPDDWGIADGSYLPHLFFGQWRVAAKLPGAESEQFVFRAKTPQEARLKIYDFVRSNPKFRDAQFTVGQDMVISADMIRLGDRRFWNLIDRIKKQGSEEVNPREAVMGIIGRKASKQKWWGSLKERMGYRGYEKDYRQVMTAYLNGFHRWRELTAVNRETQPLIEQVRREGRINAADRLDDILTNLWGRPAKSTREFDAFIRQIPLLRDYIKPLALDRWARFMNHAASLLTLRTVRFSLVNRLQPLQGLYPIIGERGMIDAKILQHTAEGRRLLDESGVSFDPGQYAGEYGTRGKVREAVERFSGERSNQELAFLAMYTHGQKLGLSHAEAVNYAKLRGQLMTQFTPLVSDTPALFEGPAGRVLFQFKRFPVKQVELTLNLARDRNVPAISRLLFSMATIGGLSFFMRQAWMDKEKQLRLKRELDKQVGQNVADGIMYGLPGLVGADISGSLVLGDEPFGENIYEKVARQLTGPSLSLGIETARNISATSRQPISATQKALAIARKIPSLRPIPELAGLLNGDVDITTPDGEVKMRRKVSDAIAGLGSFRSSNEANTQLAVSGIIEIAKEQQQLKNQWYASTEPNRVKALEAIQAFNLRWPEIAITQEDLRQYQNYRNRNSLKTDVERVARGKFSNLLPNAPKPAGAAW